MMSPHLAKLPKDWAQTVADEYEKGASDVEVRAKLRITTGLWDALMEDAVESPFREVVEFGRMLAKAWWLSQGRQNLHNKAFNQQLWHMNMKNRFGWSDKTETVTKSVEAMSQDELEARIKKAVAKFNKVVK